MAAIPSGMVRSQCWAEGTQSGEERIQRQDGRI